MIIYQKGSILGLGRDFLTIMQGSALPRAFVSSSAALCVYLIMYYTAIDENFDDIKYLAHPYTVGFLASVTCFAIIFRSQSAIARYYEAARETHSMQSKIADATSMAVTFSYSALVDQTEDSDAYEKRLKAHNEFCDLIIHASSLFVATAYLILRDDKELNYCVHTPGIIPAPRVASGTAAFKPYWYQDFPTWVRNTFTFANVNTEYRRQYYQHASIPVIGRIMERERKILGLANGPLAKVHLVMHWITEAITSYHLKGGFGQVHPPIVSRLFQEVSNAMLGFSQAKRIAHLPFPFIYAQLTEFLVIILMIIIPLLMIVFVNSFSLGILFTFCSCMGFCSLYEATRELEDPFLFEPNDLPLCMWQGEFNEMLLLLNKYSSGSDEWEHKVSSKSVKPPIEVENAIPWSSATNDRPTSGLL